MVQSAKPVPPTWCPGCGDFGVLAAVKRAAAELKIPTHELVLVGGIGCSGSIHNFLEINGIHALHGRLLAQAVGVKLANPSLTVVAAGGDGDGYAIGMGHFIHALKKNVSLVYVVMMNETYGLTKGQASPTAPVGYRGNVESPFDAVLTALSIPSASFIARGFSGDPKGATQLLTEALKFNRERKGFAFVEMLSPCVTYNDTYKLWREKVQNVTSVAGYDAADRSRAFSTCLEIMEAGRIPIGMIYRAPEDRRLPSLDQTVLPTLEKAPATTDISLATNLPRYQKLIDALT